MELAITDIIKRYLKNWGLTQHDLSERIGETQQNTNRKLKAKSLDTDYLMRICLALGKDFFADMSDQLRKKMDENRVGVSEPETAYSTGKLTYQNLLEENILLHRQTAELRQQLHFLKGGKPGAAQPSPQSELR